MDILGVPVNITLTEDTNLDGNNGEYSILKSVFG